MRNDSGTAAARPRSKIIYAVAAWLLLNAALSVWMVGTTRGPLSDPDKLQNLAGVVVAATVAIGLVRHRRWAMWLYFAYAAIGLVVYFGRGAGAAGRGADMVAVALAAVLIPAILIWFRRDRLDPAPSERPNA